MESLTKMKTIRLSKSCIGGSEKKAVMCALKSEFLGMGSQVEEFEIALSVFFGRPAVCVTNGTAALQLALQACGIGENDEVLVQSLTYVASFQAISAVGAKPISCDINETSLTIDLRDAERRLSSKTKAIMPVHYAGDVGDLSGVYEFASKYGLRVIEDAAHAFGSVYQGIRVGGFGDVACFSFDGIKNITSGEGGCIVTSDPTVLQKVMDARLLGVHKDTERRFRGERSWEFDVSSQGWRYHMSNIMAAIGIEQIKKFDHFAKRRQELANLYDLELENLPNLEIFKRDYSLVVPHIYPVRIPNLKNRGELQNLLMRHGIQTGIHYQPNHLLSFYKEASALPLKTTNKIFPELISLPLHPDLTSKNVKFICKTLKELLSSKE